MINPKDVVEGLAHQRAEQTCTHPTEHIRDFPDGSVCRKCGGSVPPLMRDSVKSTFPVFPSSGEE